MAQTQCVVKKCSNKFKKERGEPFYTDIGLLCLQCLKKSGKDCRCKAHRLYRNILGGE